MNIKLKPFMVPNFVIQESGSAAASEQGYALTMVDAQELSDMCDVFRAAVFKKAGKADPALPSTPTQGE
jgi:hypothetical protein